ncbi:tRNA (adenosine(37)-N6)-threonylcarbamoyltransferase complex dimerization subunit type 1 TsaB [Methylotuvimicrobium buryatense]|uniref:tRNA threonylcarbamoyladenosine biosynthesis protein TsaB n=1 Tax=Methylotuvimicrobium buryatense TaxID=95641 RepID=A0A4P9UQ89_METBY|nr:tRNA (adenosine(37)-N6)-threonylcarbamoyltransferase complex dimerization subunit type 1 TsaB [Methylotuvimicrobium buryatense]QCW83594.1 tRNA (adenosine(37)-N6)-threonylcarbamoyltransferase complex dimerization subunit type 1 TsaB [Methylotuvimicrobium buryatense]
MKLLAVDTATEACSAALYIDGEILERFELAPRTHTQLILPMIDSLMAEAGLAPHDLEGLAFGRGPGSFTGVRIATGVIQGVALGLDLPIVPVSTLAALAQDYFGRATEEVVFAGMDARMGEVFWGVYRKNDQGFAEVLGSESVGPAENVVFPELKGYGIGSGWKTYRDALGERMNGWLAGVDDTPLPKASAIALLGARSFNLGQAVPVEQAMPVYLRDKVAKKESER